MHQHREGRIADLAVPVGIVLGASVVAATASTTVEFGLRAAVWAVAGLVAATVAPRRRPEPSPAWLAIAVGAVLVSVSWALRSADASLRQLGELPDLFSGAGMVVGALGLLLAGRGVRERVALLDGTLLAGAMSTFIWALLVEPEIQQGTTELAKRAATLHTGGAVLVLGLGAAIALDNESVRSASSRLMGIGLIALLFAGVGWGWQGLRGHEQAGLGSASWLVAGAVIAVVANRREDESLAPEATARGSHLLTPVRFALLVILTVMPALTVGVLRAAPSMRSEAVPVTLGLWVTTGSVLVLAIRVRASGGFAVQDAVAGGHERLARLTQHSADVVCIITDEGLLEYVSPSCQRVFSLAPDELTGRSVAEVIEDGSHERLAYLLDLAVQAGGRPVPIRVGVVAGDGLVRPAEGSITDLRAVPSVGGLVVTLRDVSERVALEAELKRAALEDPLTGLANRTLLHDRVRHALAQHARGGQGIALAYLDLDDFKQVNDSHGHAAGDRLLLAVASRMQDALRDVDTAGRLGGDEFAILFEGLPRLRVEEAAVVVIDRVLEAFVEPVEVGNDLLEIKVSIGLAIATDGATTESLVQDADTAMYEAKRQGADLAIFRSGVAVLRT